MTDRERIRRAAFLLICGAAVIAGSAIGAAVSAPSRTVEENAFHAGSIWLSGFILNRLATIIIQAWRNLG